MLTSTMSVCPQESCIENYKASSIPETHLEARFECPICLQCLKDPILTSCGHRFCNDCINQWFRKKGYSCPVDGQHLKQESDLFPDNFTRREINNLEERLSSSDVQEEQIQNSSPQERIRCCFHDVGCAEILNRDEMAAHLESYTQNHLQLLSMAHKKLESSVQEERVEVKAEEANFWEPDSKEHKSNMNGGPWQGLLRSLYKRIVVLEQRHHEQEIQIDNLKRQITVMSAACSTKIERFSHDVMTRYCGGTLIWTIPKISQKLQKMLVTPNQHEYSPCFYTTPTGYRFCARLNLSPKEHDHLALLIHLKRGEYDAYLDWPFNGRIIFTLINHMDSNVHLRETIMTPPSLEAFKRPSGEINPRGFGYTEFISIHDLQQQGFVHDDSIVITIQVQRV